MPIAETPKSFSAPPRKSASKSQSTPRVTAESVKEQRIETVAGVFQMLSGIAAGFGQWADAGTIEMHGGTLAREFGELGSKYESLGTKIDNLSQVTPFLGIATVGFAITVQIATNHKLISKETGVAMGAIPPDVLEGEMRLKATQRAYRMQAEAQAREAAMMEELALRQQAFAEETADSR